MIDPKTGKRDDGEAGEPIWLRDARQLDAELPNLSWSQLREQCQTNPQRRTTFLDMLLFRAFNNPPPR